MDGDRLLDVVQEAEASFQQREAEIRDTAEHALGKVNTRENEVAEREAEFRRLSERFPLEGSHPG